MKFIIIFVALLLLASPILAQQAALTGKSMTPEQTAIATVQQQRNAAQAQVSDLQATMSYMQAQTALEKQYWADYVKGLYGDRGLEK